MRSPVLAVALLLWGTQIGEGYASETPSAAATRSVKFDCITNGYGDCIWSYISENAGWRRKSHFGRPLLCSRTTVVAASTRKPMPAPRHDGHEKITTRSVN